ncbi:MAG TPA: hypothetical protein VGT41_06415, partial [Candidatus Babeliales bacterium]|nr:hypothetical protein [Candidatus Babeliales bacterium]
MRVSKRAVFLVLLFLHISPLCSNSFTTDDGQFAQTLAAELHAMEEAAKKYELHRTEEYKNAAAKHCANRIRDHMNEKTQKQLMTDFSKRLFPPSSCEPTSNPSHASDAHEPPCTQANPSPRTPHHANYNTHHPCVDAPYISSSGTSLVDKMGTASQRLGAYAQHRDRIEAQCSWAHNRSQALEKENKQIKFTLMHQKLPKDFQQSFEKRGLLEKAFAKGVERSQYKEEFYLDLLEKCGEYFTHEQLVQHQYAQMHRWKEYHNEEFRKFLQTFALYNDYVLEIDKHFKTCTGCCFKKVHACETKAYHCIANQAAALHKKYEQAKNQAQKLHAYNAHQRHLCMQEIFTSQMPDLDAVALEWQETRPERAQAYNETVANPKKLAQQKYTVSPEAADCLLHHGFDPTDYQELYGNPLQHELFRELLDGIEFLAQLPQVDRATPFDVMARTATLETFADARKVNEMGDCVGASKLIDFGVSLLEYSAAAVGGLGSGVWKGIKKTGTDIAHIVCHLDQVVMALGLVVVHFADLIYNYVPFDDVMSTTFDEQDCERIAKNWAKQSNKAVNWWKKTPAHDKMHQVVEVPVGFLTNAILFGCCASFASKLAT